MLRCAICSAGNRGAADQDVTSLARATRAGWVEGRRLAASCEPGAEYGQSRRRSPVPDREESPMAQPRTQTARSSVPATTMTISRRPGSRAGSAISSQPSAHWMPSPPRQAHRADCAAPERLTVDIGRRPDEGAHCRPVPSHGDAGQPDSRTPQRELAARPAHYRRPRAGHPQPSGVVDTTSVSAQDFDRRDLCRPADRSYAPRPFLAPHGCREIRSREPVRRRAAESAAAQADHCGVARPRLYGGRRRNSLTPIYQVRERAR
jgi:hypothetical protein